MFGLSGRWAALAWVTLLIGGCTVFPTQPAVDRAWFLLEVPAGPELASSPVPVELASVRVAPVVAGKGLVYRLGAHRFESDFYNEWFLLPRDHVEHLLRERWTREHAAVRLVADARGEPEARQVYVLMTALHGDLDTEGPGAAVVGMRVFVQTGDSRQLWELERRTPIVARTPEALVAALSSGMGELLLEIEQRLGG